MKKISSNLRVTEIATAANNFIRLYQGDANVGADVFLKTTMADIANLSGQLTEAIQRGVVKVGLDEADAARDDVIRDLGTLIEGYTAIPFVDQKDAARALKCIFDKYGKRIASEPFAVESSLIESMIIDFKVPEALTAIAILPGVAELLAQLRTAQDAFNAASDRRTEINAAIKQPTASELKKELVLLLNDRLIPFLDIMGMVNPDVFGAFTKQIEVEIERANATVAKRGTKE